MACSQDKHIWQKWRKPRDGITSQRVQMPYICSESGRKQWTEWKEIRIVHRRIENSNKDRKAIKGNQIEILWLKPCGWNPNSAEGLSRIADQGKPPGRSGQGSGTDWETKGKRTKTNKHPKGPVGYPQTHIQVSPEIQKEKIGGVGWEKRTLEKVFENFPIWWKTWINTF